MTRENFDKVADMFIEDESIKEKVKKVLAKVNDKFYEAAASSTGKYHPKYALGDGGLARHTIAACLIAKDLCGLTWFADIKRDYCMAAIILHDTCKSGKEWKSRFTQFKHPILAAELVEECFADSEDEGDKQFVKEVSPMIRSHMGQWNTSTYEPDVVLDLPETLEQKFVFLSDYLASRKTLEVNFETIDFNVY